MDMKEPKYPKVKLEQGQYYVYVHTATTEDKRKLYYVGMSCQQPADRWRPSKYKTTALQEYIERFGWDNIGHQVLAVVADKSSAETLEDQMITALRMNGMVINERLSGGHARDNDDVRKEYMREYQTKYQQSERGKAAHRKAQAKRNAKPEWKIYKRVHNFNRLHPDLAIETPLEAKQRYLSEGYIPDYIKHDDL